MSKKLTQYSNKQAISEVLGSFIQQPSLMKEYKVVKEDFPEAFHRLIFAAAYNLYFKGAATIDAVAIDEFLSHYDSQYAIFTRNDGMNYIDSIVGFASTTNIKYYYDQLKKFSLLRDYVAEGIDVSEFYDPDEIEPALIEEKRARLDSSTLADIVTHFKKKQLLVAAKYLTSSDATSKKAGVGGHEQKELWKKGIDWGIGYASAYLTTALSGMRAGKFVVKSAPSGTGKTRCALADVAFSCSPKYYDKRRGCWCDNPNGKDGVLYIGTEMELLTEIDPILWAYIADVPEDHIKKGTYEPGEEERVDKAIDLLINESNIWLEYIPEYSASTLENIIEQHVVKHNIKHVFFDYIHTTSELISEYATDIKGRMNMREDQVLADLSNKLKNLARRLNISIDTATQVSGDYKNSGNRDATIIRGSKAIADKADGAYIMTRPNPLELKKVEPIIRNCFESETPNLLITLYKNRGNKWNSLLVWLYVDYDTMRTHDLFVTDLEYNLIEDIPKTYINVIDGGDSASTTPSYHPEDI